MSDDKRDRRDYWVDGFWAVYDRRGRFVGWLDPDLDLPAPSQSALRQGSEEEGEARGAEPDDADEGQS